MNIIKVICTRIRCFLLLLAGRAMCFWLILMVLVKFSHMMLMKILLAMSLKDFLVKIVDPFASV